MRCEIIPHEWTLEKGFYVRAKAAPFEGINSDLGQRSRVCSLPETQTHYALLSHFSGHPLRPNTMGSVLGLSCLITGGASQLGSSCATWRIGNDEPTWWGGTCLLGWCRPWSILAVFGQMLTHISFMQFVKDKVQKRFVVSWCNNSQLQGVMATCPDTSKGGSWQRL